ncbi:MAG: hypothetical protein ACR2JC_16220 [Chloroflexota bacterium]|nr:MAG: hypothetical protein DLM70_12990 [Chloroflexota bacterium]
MALEDFVDPEVGIAVAATALVLSPRVRGLIRQGMIYGLAGAMKAGDTVSNAARGAAATAQQTAASTVTEARTQAETPVPAPPSTRRTRGASSDVTAE